MSHAVGYTGLGVGASRFGARVALDLLGDEPTELTRLRFVRRPPLPFPPEPLRSVGIGLTRRAIARPTATTGAEARGCACSTASGSASTAELSSLRP